MPKTTLCFSINEAQAFETLAGDRHRLAQVQTFGFGRRHLVLQHFVLGAQLVHQGDDLFDLVFERIEFGVHGAHYRG